jgi:hypothetical protein
MDSFDSKINEVQLKIDVEKKCMDGAQLMLKKLFDKNALQQCEQNLMEAEQRLTLLYQEMQKIQLQRFAETGIAVEQEYHSIPTLSEPGFSFRVNTDTRTPPSLRQSTVKRSSSNMLAAVFDVFGMRSRSNSDIGNNSISERASTINTPPTATEAAVTDFGSLT